MVRYIAVLQTRVLTSITEVTAAQWNELQPTTPCPLTEHGYLAALELSGSLARGGLEASYLTAWEGDRLVAAAPCFRNTSERADAMPDWSRKVATKHDLPYYPTLYIGVPYSTPCTPKFLTHPGADRATCVTTLIDAAKELIRPSPSPIIHVYYTTEEEARLLESAGFHGRITPRYAWRNRGYESFDAFLADIRSSKRSAIRTERKRFAASAARVHLLRGDDLTPDAMDYMWQAHARTVEKHGSDFDFYTREFFPLLAEHLRSRVALYVGELAGERLGAHLALVSASTLYIRLWGATREAPEAPYLYFEATYYRPIEDAIQGKLTTIDPGGPGPQKIARGFYPIGFSHAATWVGDPDLDEVTATLIAKERAWMPKHLDEQRGHSPLMPSALEL